MQQHWNQTKKVLKLNSADAKYVPLVLMADLATEQECHLTTRKQAERTKLDFRYPICRSAIGQASRSICAPSRQLTFPFCC